MTPGKTHTVAAKVRSGGAARGHVFLDLYSEEAGWSILVLDDKLRPVTQAFGERKSDVWAEVENELKKRGLLASSAPVGPTLDRGEPAGQYITAMEVVGTAPITYNPGSNKRQSYRAWVAALDVAARDAAARARPTPSEQFSLRCELRLYTPFDQGSDLDNYVKPIQDALARHGVFGETEYVGSTMKGDERVDHVDIRRKRVGSTDEAGVLAEVWALHS